MLGSALRRFRKLVPGRRSRLLRAAACLMTGLGVLLGLGPFESPVGGMLGPIGLLLLAHSLKGAPLTGHLLWGFLTALCTSAIAFQWLLPTITVYGHLGWPAATALFVCHSLLFGLKFPVMLIGIEVLRRKLHASFLAAAGLAVLVELFLPQLFPWFWGDLAGASLWRSQSAAAIGVYGLGFLIFLEAGLLLFGIRLFLLLAAGGGVRRALRAPATTPVLAGLVLLTIAYAYNWKRLGNANELLSGPPLRITLVQPNTGRGLQEFKNDEEFAARALNNTFNKALEGLVRSRGTTDLLVLPESAVPFHSTRDAKENSGLYSPSFHGVVAFLAHYGNTDVLYNELDRRSGKLYNVATLYSQTGRREGSYVKQKLLPFGEYLPFESILPMRRILPEASDYVAGTRPEVLAYRYTAGRIPKQPPPVLPEDLALLSEPKKIMARAKPAAPTTRGALAPLICYEGLFPDLVRDFILHGEKHGLPVDFLVNISNDAWFGDYLENYQHASGAHMRAVETGRYLVRGTLSGSSAVYDPLGRAVLAPTRAGTATVHTVTVARRPNATTLYLRYGNFGSLALCAFACLVLLGTRIKIFTLRR